MPQEFWLGFYTGPKVSVFRLVLNLDMNLKDRSFLSVPKNGKKKTLCDALAVLKQRILRCCVIPPRCVHKSVDKIMTIFYNQSSSLMLKAQENTTGLKEPVMSRNETNGPLKHVKANAGPNFNRLLFISSTATLK